MFLFQNCSFVNLYMFIVISCVFSMYFVCSCYGLASGVAALEHVSGVSACLGCVEKTKVHLDACLLFFVVLVQTFLGIPYPGISRVSIGYL